MVAEGPSSEQLREALTHLYDPAVLATLPLSAQLAEAGILRARTGLYDVLVSALERLKPPGAAPLQSHGWRCYRYLVLRYVECLDHDAIARELGISGRQGYRVHTEALDALSAIIFNTGKTTSKSMLPSGSYRGRTTPEESPPFEPTATIASDWAPTETDLTVVGRQPPDNAVDVVDLARSVEDMLQRIVTRQGVRLCLEFPDQLPPVKVNRVCLRQIVLNLALYLVQSVHHGSLVLQGKASLTAVTFSLVGECDPREDGEDCSPTSSEGEALLSAARSLAHLQRIALDESGFPPRSFHLLLPVGSVHTILLVDDNPDIGDLVRRMLSRTSFHLVHCRTGERALQLARENHPEIIILDVVMPTRDGWEILTLLQQNPATARIPVVVCSVLPDRELALALDAAAFLPKPVTQQNLLETLRLVTIHQGNAAAN